MAEQLQEDLLVAVQDCDMAEIEACLEAGASLTSVGLIHECVSTDDLQIVTALLARGGQVNQRDADGRTPLHCAQSRGVADVLLRAGADTTARDANGLTPVEERRAFGVRGLNEVADFIASWSGRTDLKPRNMDEILEEETAIRDEISRLQSAVSQMSGAADAPQAPASPEDAGAAPPSPPSVVNRQREEYARARGLPPTATWEEITEFDAAQRGAVQRRPPVPVANSPPPAVSPQAAFAAESAAFAAGESGAPAFAARDRLARSPPREDPTLAYGFEEAEAAAAQLSDGDNEEKETSPFAARTELPRSPKRHNSMGSLTSPLATEEQESDRSPYRYGALESVPFRNESAQRTNSGSSSPGGSSRGGRSPMDRERLLATVEALAAAEAEIEATVEEAEAAAAEAEARSAAAAARAEAARERARLEASRAAAGFGSGSRLQLSPETRRAGRDSVDSAIPADVGELLRACLRSEVMAAAHRRISDHDNQHGLNKDADAVVSTFGALFRFVAQLTRLGDPQQEAELWQMLRQTVDGASPRPASSYQLNRRGQPDDAASGGGGGGGYSFDVPARTGSGERSGGAASRSAIDDSSAERRAELRRLTQNLVTTATDRTAAALRESGLDRSGSGGSNGDGTTWRTPGGLEYSSPPTRTGSGGGSVSARSARQEETASPPVGLRSPPAISSIERKRRQQNASGSAGRGSGTGGGERVGRPPPGGPLSPPIGRAASAAAVASQQAQWRSSPKPAVAAAPPTPGKAWIEIEETPLRPPPSAGGNSGGYSGAIGGPDDDPFAGAGTPGATAEAPISVAQLRANMQEHIEPATPPVVPDTEQGEGGADAAATAAKREKVRKIREERQLAKQQAEVRARDKAEQALRDKQMREARQERRLTENEMRIAEVKAKKRTPSRAVGGAGTPGGGSGLDDSGMSGDLSARGGDLSATM